MQFRDAEQNLFPTSLSNLAWSYRYVGWADRTSADFCYNDEFNHDYQRLGVKTGAERRTPTGNPSPAPTHPHHTHDTTDQWREIRLVASPIFGFMSSSPGDVPSNVKFTKGCCRAAFCHTHKLILTILRFYGNPMDQNVNKTNDI